MESFVMAGVVLAVLMLVAGALEGIKEEGSLRAWWDSSC